MDRSLGSLRIKRLCGIKRPYFIARVAIRRQDRVESVKEHDRIAIDPTCQAPHARTRDALAANFPRPRHSLRPVLHVRDRQASDSHPAGVVAERTKRGTEKSLADVVDLLRLSVVRPSPASQAQIAIV